MTKISKTSEVINNVLLNFSKINRKLGIPLKFRKKLNIIRHTLVLNKIRPMLLEAYKKTISDNHTINTEFSNDGPIWVFWWQGEKGMPLIVRKCYESVIRNADGRQVKLITKCNFRKYTDISEKIINKREKNIITLTHFSDILRFNLLKNHGGLWIDATVYVTKKFKKKYFNSFFTCSDFLDEDYFFIAKGRWTGFLIGGDKGTELFAFMDNFFKIYWENNHYLIDYALFFAWKRNVSSFYDFTIITKKKNNPNLFKLSEILNDPFDLQEYLSIQNDTEMYKLSYKKKISKKKNTFFDTIIRKNVNINDRTIV